MDTIDPQKGTPAKVRTLASDIRHVKSTDRKPVKKTDHANETVPVIMPEVFKSSAPASAPTKQTRSKGTKNHSLFGGLFHKKKVPEKIKEHKNTGHVQELVPKEVPAKKLSAEELLKQPVKPGKIKKDSILAESDGLFDIKGEQTASADGTIVTETKRKRWSFSREVGKSVSKWVENVVYEPATPEDKKTAQMQKEVAEKTAKESRLQKVRTFQADSARATGKPEIKPQKKESKAPEKVEWKNINKPPVTIKEEAQKGGVASIVEKIFPHKSSIKSKRRVRTGRPQAPQHVQENVIAKDTEFAIAPRAEQKIPDREFLKKIEKKTPPLPERKQAPSRDIPFELPDFEAKEAHNYRTLREDAIEDVEKKKLSVARIASAEAVRRDVRKETIDLRKEKHSLMPMFAIVGVILLVAAGGFMFIQLSNPAPENTEITSIPSYVRVAETVPVPLSENRTAFLNDLNNAKNQEYGLNGTFVQIYPDVSTGTIPLPASTARIMSILDIHAPGSFIRSLEEGLMFGLYIHEHSEPFIIMKSNRFDTAFAGMLEWEPSISADLTPFLGEPVRRTLDPTSRTIDQSSDARFVDDVIRNRDVRILYNELGEERIIYSFIDQQTILITTSPDTFVAIVESLK